MLYHGIHSIFQIFQLKFNFVKLLKSYRLLVTLSLPSYLCNTKHILRDMAHVGLMLLRICWVIHFEHYKGEI